MYIDKEYKELHKLKFACLNVLLRTPGIVYVYIQTYMVAYR